MPRPLRLAAAAALLTGILSARLASAAAEDGAGARVVRGLAYAEPVADDPDAHTLDLSLPGAGRAKPPLLIFVPGHFWADRGGERSLGPHFTSVLQEQGAAVALVRHRLAPAHRHPAAAQDVASAVAFLLARADRFGFDPQRVYLGGHASGAHLAALVGLDPAYLAAQGGDPARLAGLILISGVYDLDPDPAPSPEEVAFYQAAFGDVGARRAASPQRLAALPGPPVLLLVAEADIPGYVPGAVAFAEALRKAGREPAEVFLATRRDHVSVLDLADARNPARAHILSLLEIGDPGEDVRELFGARRVWRDPPLSTEAIWQGSAKVRSYDADEGFLRVANLLFQGPDGGGRLLVRARRYHAVDLFEYLAALGFERAGQGPYLTLTNARGEQAVFEVAEIRPLAPRVVIGIDEERNPFRIVDLYHTLREYSWQGDGPRFRTMARPLGGFLLFPGAEPAAPGSRVFGRYALTAESFRLGGSDPWAAVRELPGGLTPAVTRDFGCVACHRLRGAGSRAGHLRASDAALVGGFGLALEDYPAEVWRRYVFEQKRVAAEIGATPVPLEGEIAQRLYDLVVSEREARARASGGE
jgi:acetyl esterase/lipase